MVESSIRIGLLFLGRERERERCWEPGESAIDLAKAWLLHDMGALPEKMLMLSKLNDIFIGLEHMARASDLLSIHQSTDLRFVVRQSDP